MSRVSFALVMAVVGLVLLNMSVGFVVPKQPLASKTTQVLTQAPQAAQVADQTMPTGIAVYGAAMLATAAAGLLARARRTSKVGRNYFGFRPVVDDSFQYSNDVGYLPDGTPINKAGNNSVRNQAPAPAYSATPTAVASPPPVAPPAMAPPPPVVGSYTHTGTEALHGINFSYSMQKDAYADLEYLNDVGYLPDGTPMNRAGNAINHPENIQPDPHTPGAPLPRANLHNSIGYLPDGTPMNAAGNALNHPERMQPDMHITGSPLPKSHYAADVGYLVDGTDLMAAGNNFVKAPAAAVSTAAAFTGSTVQPPAASLRHVAGFAYSVQKDVYADFQFCNDVGYLPDGTPLNRAGNAMNHPEKIAPDTHVDGSPLPRANFVSDVGYLPDGTPMNRAGNAMNHPENIQPDPHSPGSALPESAYAADVGYLVDGTPLDAAGNNAVH